MGDLIKQDINIGLEFPIWFPSENKIVERNEKGELIWIDRYGYIYRAGYRLPCMIDAIFLYYLLLRSQQEDYRQEMLFTRYEILQACSLPTEGSRYYDRLEDSLKRWKNVSLEFSGTFHDRKRYLTMGFGIIDAYKIREEDKKVWIRFSPEWLLRIKESNYCKYLHFQYCKALKRPVSLKLFEWLDKSFKGSETTQISLVKLGRDKLGLTGRKVETKDGVKFLVCASDVLVKIKPAINEINRLSHNQKLLKSINIKPQNVLRVDYKITGKENDRVIIFKKKPVSIKKAQRKDKELRKPSAKKPKEPLPVQISENTKWKEAIEWLESLKEFHPDRLKEVMQLDHEEVGLTYSHIKESFKKGKVKGMGGIYRAFKEKWYLSEAKEAIVTDKKREEAKKKAKASEERMVKKEEEDKRLYAKLNAVIEKHGGRDKALYQRHPIVAFNMDSLIIETGKKGKHSLRKYFKLADVREEEFSAQRRK